MISSVVYLAAPYSNPDPLIVEARMNAFLDIDALLIEQGYVTVSPLSKHFILNRGRKIPGDWAYWEAYSKQLLSACSELLVMTSIPGWKESTGVKGEIQWAIQRDIPIREVNEHGVVLIGSELMTYVLECAQV
jgi:Domain of unknown function (DUF1937)